MPRGNLIQIRNGDAATWTAVDPVLALGERGIENDTGKEKSGDGVTVWSGLPYITGGMGGGSVMSVSVTTANGVSGTVATATTTPAISLALGAITPTSVAATGTVTGSNLSGTNTGNQTITLTGDATGSGTGSFATTLATVNSNVGSFTNSNITVNAKGLITAASNGSAGSSGFVQLAQVVTSGSAATITFSSISGSYSSLKIILCGRDTNSGVSAVVCRMKINSDATAANYTSSQFFETFTGSSANGVDTSTVDGSVVAVIPGTSGNANAIGMAEILIPSYAATTFHKIIQIDTSSRYGTTTLREIRTWTWLSTSAITALVFKAGGTAFVNGTTATLYGLT